MGAGTQIQRANPFGVEVGLGDGDDIVAVDHGVFGQTPLGPYFQFRWDAPDGSG